MEKSSIIFSLKRFIPLILLGFFILFLYSRNLEQNSRFIWDESRALVDMHRIWEQKLLTFVGPISENNLEMFPSLSYYMYLPATILSKFDPLGPVYMAVFYGLLTWLFFTKVIINQLGIGLKSFLLSLFAATAYPLVLVSRWAWNPNLVIFWFSLYLLSLCSESPFFIFVGGFSLGAALYHHYLAALTVIPALLFLPLIYRSDKFGLKKISLTLLGFVTALIPFIIFEAKNHYFLNSGNFLTANNKTFTSLSGNGYPARVWSAIETLAKMFVPDQQIFILLFLFFLVGIFIVYHQDRIVKYAFISLSLSLILFGLVSQTYPHYQYSQVPLVILFFTRFLVLNKNIFGQSVLSLLVLYSLFSSLKMIQNYTWEGDILAVRGVASVISGETNPRTNVAALAGSDTNTTGQRYRDLVLIRGKTLDRSDSYPQSRVLYVVSQSADPVQIRQDPAWEIDSFRGSIITHIWQVSSYPVYLYRFAK